MGERFADVHSWCDRRCERCPLATGRCAVARREAQRRWVRTARGEDPDDPAIQFADVLLELERAAQLVERAAREQGIDPSEPPEPEPVVSLTARRLQKLGQSFASAVRKSVDRLPDVSEPDAREVAHEALLVATKCARLVGYFDPLGAPCIDDDCFEYDAAPNLLLFEELERRLKERIPALFPDELARALSARLAEVSALVEPLRAGVSDEARAELAAMIERGEAPSPFLVREPAEAS